MKKGFVSTRECYYGQNDVLSFWLNLTFGNMI